MVGHGNRARVVWLLSSVWALVIAVVRFRCGRHPIDPKRACGKTVTILPGYLYPYRRYPLEIIQEAVFGRFMSLATWSRLELAVPVAGSTLRDWCRQFSSAAPAWLEGVTHWFAHSPKFTVPSCVTRSAEAGLLAAAGLCMDLREQELDRKPLQQSQILQRLWEWGFERLKRIPLLSTRFPEGGPAPIRPRERDPDH
jgi:hypothetical protein